MKWTKGRIRVLVLAFLTVGLASGVTTGASPAAAIGMVNEVCTGEAVAPDLFITASHCDGNLGAEVQFYIREGVAKREYVGINVWDSHYIRDENPLKEGLDLSIVRVVKGGSFKHWLSFNSRIPKPHSWGVNISMSGGLEYWTKPVLIEGMYHQPAFGWVLVYRGDALPGASGSVILQDGKIVGLLTNGILERELFIGATAGRLMQAIRDYRWQGDMIFVLENDSWHIERVQHH